MSKDKSDFELVKRFVNGDESAFNEIARSYQEKIYWHARRMVGNHFDADEILQTVLITIYKKLHDFRFQSSLYTWIFRIVHTRSLNLLKKNKVKNAFSLDSVSAKSNDALNDIIKDVEAREKVEMMQQKINTLPEKQREVFIMRNFDELSYEEISKITGKSEGALKANYFHALKRIKEEMKKND